MSTEEEQKVVPDANENQEEEKEEEPVDLELQKEMKGLKIEDSDFHKEEKTKKNGKKSKNQEGKKTKKKGQDFIDYANKNNIQINIEYEENKYQLKNKGNQKVGEKGGNIFNDNKKQYNRGGYKNDKNRPQKRQQQHMFTGNKFDSFSQRPHFQPNYYQRQSPKKLTENKEIFDYLEKLFGEDSLNKNIYIRNRIKDGKILVSEILAYNDIKRNNINEEKILEIVKDSQNLECINEENKNYIKIKNFDNFKLLTVNQIYENKKNNQKMKYMPQYGYPQYPYPINNFYNFQNNPFIYNQHPSYYSPAGYAATPENK